MNAEKSLIHSVPGVYYHPGCYAVALPKFDDFRGFLIDIANEEATILKVYYSVTLPGQARDNACWHLHDKQTDRFVILQGAALFALSNGRDITLVMMCGDNPCALFVPPGIYHCFKTQGIIPCGLLNLPDQLYNPQDEMRVRFEDLCVGAPW